MNEFFQDGPVLGNQYKEDSLLRSYLARWMPGDALAEVEADLERFGERVVGDIVPMAQDVERNEPVLVPYDPWGRRIDRIDVAAGWKQLERVAAEEGLVAIGYERRQGERSRLYQFAKLYLFNPSSAVYSCPLAMADGAARAIELMGDETLREGAFRRLTSRDPAWFWTSGQWMTERTGGSDVGRTGTVARREEGGWRLYGTKWFTSATTSQMAMTLARIEDAQGRVTEGSSGLSLFYLETYNDRGGLNQIEIHRLKDKLGTRGLPTAELSLRGTPALLVGEQNRGVRNITALMNITRLYNAVSAAATLRRSIALARDYARRREAFRRRLDQHPLHVETLADLEVDFHAAFHLAFYAIILLGKEECGTASDEEKALLRMLTPLSKLYTAKLAVAAASETLECFGGAGYVEDTGLPKLLRDAQVLPIWEGTTNILSLDTLRAIEREAAFEPFINDLQRRLDATQHPALAEAVAKTRDAVNRIKGFLSLALTEGPVFQQAGARAFAYSLSRTYAASLLIEHGEWLAREQGDERGLAVARRWCRRDLAPLLNPDAAHCAESYALAFDEPQE